MEPNEDNLEESRGAVNSLILDYYKNVGRKQGLEKYFSLATAPGEARDPDGAFWQRLKAASDSSSSGDRTADRARPAEEVCRISITCSLPEDAVQDREEVPKADYESPPIISEDMAARDRQSDNESVKSEGNQSHKSVDVTLDTSTNKAHSPTSSVTSQRKLEWDSLADVGYSHGGTRHPSTSLSTLERELIQQYTGSERQDTDGDPGEPTAHSTLLTTPTVTQMKNKASKKGQIKQSRHYHAQDKDVIEVNVPRATTSSAPISVNLTKHISFNVERDGALHVDRVSNDVNTDPTAPGDGHDTPEPKYDKQVQTSILESQPELPRPGADEKPVPVLISLNTLKQRLKRRKLRKRKKSAGRTRAAKSKGSRERSGGQVSEAESFEYMPGHIYDQNRDKDRHQKSHNSAGNKSSLESSGGVTTESSRNLSFTKDLDKSIKLLNAVLERHHNDATLKKRMVKEIVQNLLSKKYRDDDIAHNLLYGLRSTKRDSTTDNMKHHTTTSTSDANNTAEKYVRPRKSILRNSNSGENRASTSQGAPAEADTHPSDAQARSDSEGSSGLYQRYLDAVRSERANDRHLRDKDLHLRQKLVGSEVSLGRLAAVITDLTRNNYDDGSGDASKLEGLHGGGAGGPRPPADGRLARSHSVFTLSSGNSRKGSDCNERESRKMNLRRRLEEEIRAGGGRGRDPSGQRCCCPGHRARCGVADSSIQVNIRCEEPEPPGPSHVRREIDVCCVCARPAPAAAAPRAHKCLQVTSAPARDVCSAGVQADPPPPGDCGASSCSPAVPSIDLRGADSRDLLDSSKLSQSSQTDVGLFGARGRGADCAGGAISQRSTPRRSPRPRPADVAEATRAVQTEISINPKIADPSISDIRVVSDCDCVQVAAGGAAASSGAPSRRSSATSLPRRPQTRDAPPPEALEPVSATRGDVDNYTIPLQGTNMTLLVSIGPAGGAVASRCVGTERAPRADRGTGPPPPPPPPPARHGGTQAETAAPFPSRAEAYYAAVRQDDKKTETKYFTFPRENSCTSVKVESEKAASTPRDAASGGCRSRNTIDAASNVSVSAPTTKERTPSRVNTIKWSKSKSDTAVRAPAPEPARAAAAASDSNTKSSCHFDCNRRDVSTDGYKITEPASNKTSDRNCSDNSDSSKDLVLETIRDITRRYDRRDPDRTKKKRCVKELISILKYLLDTDAAAPGPSHSGSSDAPVPASPRAAPAAPRAPPAPPPPRPARSDVGTAVSPRKVADKAVQLAGRGARGAGGAGARGADWEAGSSSGPASTDTATCVVLERIRRECDKYHRRRCRCRRAPPAPPAAPREPPHGCACKGRRLKPPRSPEVRKSYAYNLIVQPSDSFVQEEPAPGPRPLRDVVVRVPRRAGPAPPGPGAGAAAGAGALTVQEYLHQNRPDFIGQSARRQELLRDVRDARARLRQSKRRLLRLPLDGALTAPAPGDPAPPRPPRETLAPTFCSEKEMKQHSERIYKTLPEVQRKKEELKKEKIKKTNLLMASIFKKNLQKKALRGSVNISNYSEVIKI